MPNFEKIEGERFEKIKSMIPRFEEGFPWKVYEIILNMPIQYVVANYLYDDNK